MEKKKKKQSSVTSNVRAKWVPPQRDRIKCNVAAAVARGDDRGVVGVMCRDASGVFRGSSARTIKGVSDPATLEAMACAEALSLAEDLGFGNL
jgi:hypothetical protein